LSWVVAMTVLQGSLMTLRQSEKLAAASVREVYLRSSRENASGTVPAKIGVALSKNALSLANSAFGTDSSAVRVRISVGEAD